MKWFSVQRIVIAAFILGLVPDWAAAEKLPVFVSILPQTYFVQQIGKERVEVRVMVQPGANAESYEPKPKQMAEITGARLYFAIGLPFEKVWLKKIASANPNMKVVHTDRAIEKIPMETHHHGEEDDPGKAEHRTKGGPPGEGGHDGKTADPHIWLSPPLVIIQARTILQALQEEDPSHRDVYQGNYDAFVSEVAALDRELKDVFHGKKGLRFMVFHPAWGYFAQAYGLDQVPIEIEGKDPKPAQLKALIGRAREEGIKVIFVQPQFSSKSAQVVAREIRGQVAFADPLAADWPGNLREVALKFREALR